MSIMNKSIIDQDQSRLASKNNNIKNTGKKAKLNDSMSNFNDVKVKKEKKNNNHKSIAEDEKDQNDSDYVFESSMHQ